MPTVEKKRTSPALLWGGAIVLLILIAILVRVSTRSVVEVRVAPVTHQNLVSSVSTNGKVEPIEQYQAHAPAAGVVNKVFVHVGEKVSAGTLMVRMNDSDAVSRIASANASLKSAEAAYSDIEHNGSQEERIGLTGDLKKAQLQQQQDAQSLSALEQLQQKGAASASEVQAARDRLNADNASLQNLHQRSNDRYSSGDKARARAQVAEARAALASAESSYSAVNIRAPFAGTVYSIPVNDYDFVASGDTLLNLADLDRIRVRAYFDEPEIGKLAAGQPVTIVWDAKPGRVWHGHIMVAPTTIITYGTRNVGECLISVDDAHGDLLPNTNVTVTVTTSQRFNVLSIPREALHSENGANYVYRVVGNRLVYTPVQVGISNLTRAEITGGLSENDVVALNAASNRDLSNGLKVKLVE